MRARVRYRKQGRLRFISAIDVGRVWERALRRADLPIAYSEGFSPHPKVSFTDALPLGYASEAEYAELLFAGTIDLPAAVTALNEAFPAGMAVTTAVAVPDGAPRFAKLLQASCWDVAYPGDNDPAAAVHKVAAADALVVGRERKGETTDVDIRLALHQISVEGPVVRMVIRHADHLPDSAAVAVRPSEVDLALRQFQPLLDQPVLVTRLAQGRPEATGLVEALHGERVEPLHPDQRQST